MTDHDFNGNESVIPSDIEYTLSRIGTIADSVDSSMTVGEIVRRAYLCGVGDTLDEFRKLVDRRTFVDSAIDGAIAIDDVTFDRVETPTGQTTPVVTQGHAYQISQDVLYSR